MMHRRGKTVQNLAVMPYADAAQTATSRVSPTLHTKSL